jgi:hypothetical protein
MIGLKEAKERQIRGIEQNWGGCEGGMICSS